MLRRSRPTVDPRPAVTRRVRPAGVAALLVTGCAAALPATASAQIVVNQSIAGVRVGATLAEVKARLGEPGSIRDASFHLDTNLRIGLSALRYGTLTVTVVGTPKELTDASQVNTVATTNRRERTSSGIRVGISRGALKRRAPGVTCDSWTSRRHTTRVCSKENKDGLGVVTRYAMTARWRVQSISIGQVID